MAILRIQHPVPDFDRWRRAFDSDPADRQGSGVRRYRVHRSIADPLFVMIDLEFDTVQEAESLLAKMRQLWAGSAAGVMRDPEAWIAETVETVELG